MVATLTLVASLCFAPAVPRTDADQAAGYAGLTDRFTPATADAVAAELAAWPENRVKDALAQLERANGITARVVRAPPIPLDTQVKAGA